MVLAIAVALFLAAHALAYVAVGINPGADRAGHGRVLGGLACIGFGWSLIFAAFYFSQDDVSMFLFPMGLELFLAGAWSIIAAPFERKDSDRSEDDSL